MFLTEVNLVHNVLGKVSSKSTASSSNLLSVGGMALKIPIEAVHQVLQAGSGVEADGREERVV